jgi:branched-chain amino acid transport system permease protein
MALGLSLLYGVMRLINFAHGEMITGTMLMLCFLEKTLNIPLFFKVIFVVMTLICLLFGLDKLLFRRILIKNDKVQFICMASLE